MPHDGANWRVKAARGVALRRCSWHRAIRRSRRSTAQNFVRGPNINIGPRAAVINPNMSGRRSAPTSPVGAASARRDVAHACRCPRAWRCVRNYPYSAHIRRTSIPSCGWPSSRRQWRMHRRAVADSRRQWRRAASGKTQGRSRAAMRRRRGFIAPTVPNEIVAEIDSALTDEQADALARRHGMRRIVSQNFPLIGATIGLFRISDGRSFETVRREFAAEGSVRSAQPNSAISSRTRRRRRPRATRHNMRWPSCDCRRRTSSPMATDVRVAVIDSGIDVKHRRTCRLDRRELRCARRQRRPACPRHRHCRRDRGPCAVDGQRAGGAESGDPRLQRNREWRAEQFLRDPEGAGLRRAHGTRRSSI